MENEAAAIIAKSSPQQIATGELVVLKNTIKKFCKGPMRSELMKLANSELGAICSKITAERMPVYQAKIAHLKELAKCNNQLRLRDELREIRSTGI
ncbi:hypothetical protein ABF162_07415 [Vibrio coralliilyticus]|uniref:hypothetical protein n=1 Tax=Vibrio coralliilyticus TaxID=190893 RepID=UPI000512970C|nr:hypothetical protein [Vibrio coralliilyticus]AIU66856.1 hypothetical protein JV59_31410 [Vibrio coralliilyticus]